MLQVQRRYSNAVHALQQIRLQHMQVGTHLGNLTYSPTIERRIVVIRCKS